jgi:hypothetical protein
VAYNTPSGMRRPSEFQLRAAWVPKHVPGLPGFCLSLTVATADCACHFAVFLMRPKSLILLLRIERIRNVVILEGNVEVVKRGVRCIWYAVGPTC